jgi:hypothetical protein
LCTNAVVVVQEFAMSSWLLAIARHCLIHQERDYPEFLVSASTWLMLIAMVITIAYNTVAESASAALLPHMETIVLGGTNGSRLWYNYRSGQHTFVAPAGCDSDMLCVETDCLSSSRPGLVFHGHRDGSITMHDSRTDKTDTHTVAFPAAPGMEEDKFGSVARIQLLFDQRPDQLIARGSNTTCCRLFDARNLGESSAQRRGRSAMIHEMVLPAEVATAPNTGSSVKGMAADPHRAIAIAPFKNETQRACFGMWSLDSGEFIGHKTATMTCRFDIDDQMVELCPTVTRAWHFKDEGRHTCHRRGPEGVELVPGSYGLWFDWGHHGVGHIVFHQGDHKTGTSE